MNNAVDNFVSHWVTLKNELVFDNNSRFLFDKIVSELENVQMDMDLSDMFYNYDEKKAFISLFMSAIENLLKLIDNLAIKTNVKIFESKIFAYKFKVGEILDSNPETLLWTSLDLKELEDYPYEYMSKTLIYQRAKIVKNLQEISSYDIERKLENLSQIDFLDLKLLSKVEDFIERKNYIDIENIENLIYFWNMFRENISNLKIEESVFKKIVDYKRRFLYIVKLNLKKLEQKESSSKRILFLEKQLYWHLNLLKERLEFDINYIFSRTTKKEARDILHFPDLSNVIKIYKLILKENALEEENENVKSRAEDLILLLKMAENINSLDPSNVWDEERADALEWLEELYEEGKRQRLEEIKKWLNNWLYSEN